MRATLFSLSVVLCLGASALAQTPGPTDPCDGKVDALGDFIWARARGSEKAVFTDAQGNGGGADRSHIFSSAVDSVKYLRNNFTSLRNHVAYTVQTKEFHLTSKQPFNGKLILGYMSRTWRFTHGDNKDLVHWADVPRVVLFVPIRHELGADPNVQSNYFISPYGGQTISVVEFGAGEVIDYGWYGNPSNLNEHILFDLYPYCGGTNDLKPCVNHPIFKFEVLEAGKWKVSIERDGRDGLAGGDNNGDFDMVFTETSAGARPYSVNLGSDIAYGLSIYHPSSDFTYADMSIGVAPFDRRTGEALDQFDRSAYETGLSCGAVEELIARYNTTNTGEGRMGPQAPRRTGAVRLDFGPRIIWGGPTVSGLAVAAGETGRYTVSGRCGAAAR